MTTAQKSRAEWLEARRSGIGGSDVAAILGVSKWKTAVDVYFEKIGEAEPQAESDAMRWGTILEPVIREEFQRQTGIELVEPPQLIRSSAHPFMIASLDGMTVDGEIVECKTARSADGWGEAGSDEIPIHYQTQVAHYLAVTGARLAFVPVLIGASDFRVYQVERCDSFIADLVEAERAFWSDHVLTRIPPEPVNADDAARLWARDNGATVEIDGSIADDVDELKRLKEEEKELAGRISEVSDRIRIAFGEAAAIAFEGKTLATYKAQSSKRLDSKALELAHPEIVTQYKRESVSRVLRLK